MTVHGRGGKAARNTARKQRAKNARRHVPDALARQGGVCRWCGRKIVLLTEVRRLHRVIRETHDWVVYEVGDSVVKTMIATADHVVPSRDGGTSRRSNIVAACGNCNRDRTEQNAERLARRRCRCGDMKMAHETLCAACRDDDKRSYLLSRGWRCDAGLWVHPKRGTRHDMNFAVRIQRRHLES